MSDIDSILAQEKLNQIGQIAAMATEKFQGVHPEYPGADIPALFQLIADLSESAIQSLDQ